MEKNNLASACNTADRKSMSAQEIQIKELINIGEAVPLSSLSTLYYSKFGSDDFVRAVGELYAHAKTYNVNMTFSDSSGTTLLDTKIPDPGKFYKDEKNANFVHENLNTRIAVRRALDSECPDWQVEQKFSHNTGKVVLYVAKRVGLLKDYPIAVLRVQQPKYFLD